MSEPDPYETIHAPRAHRARLGNYLTIALVLLLPVLALAGFILVSWRSAAPELCVDLRSGSRESMTQRLQRAFPHGTTDETIRAVLLAQHFEVFATSRAEWRGWYGGCRVSCSVRWNVNATDDTVYGITGGYVGDCP